MAAKTKSRKQLAQDILSLLADFAHNGADSISFSAIVDDTRLTLREAVRMYAGKAEGC